MERKHPPSHLRSPGTPSCGAPTRPELMGTCSHTCKLQWFDKIICLFTNVFTAHNKSSQPIWTGVVCTERGDSCFFFSCYPPCWGLRVRAPPAGDSGRRKVSYWIILLNLTNYESRWTFWSAKTIIMVHFRWELDVRKGDIITVISLAPSIPRAEGERRRDRTWVDYNDRRTCQLVDNGENWIMEDV